MSHIAHDIIARGEARIVEQPAAPQPNVPDVDRSFGMPKALYGATVALYLGFVLVMGAAFANPEMAIPVAIFAIFIIAGFGVPTIWARLAANTSEPATLGEFGVKGIMTHTGRLAPRDATVQMLILPVLLVVWGLTVAVIAAVVS
jgi:hypothetical protein